MRHYSILEYAGFRWLKGALLLCALAAVAYLWHDPPLKPYGGTWLGYTLGTIGALLILWLLWFGVRKRRYRSTSSSVQGWLSAHVYLGTALVVVTTLHTGFELGWNIHTLAYLLMLAVVASGFYGVFVYLNVPKAITANLGEDTLDALVLQLGDIDRKLRAAGLSVPDELMALVNASVSGTCLGGSLRRIVTGRDAACPTAAAIRQWPERARQLTGDAARAAKDAYALLLQKNAILERARRDLAFRARLEGWLYVHVPLAIALLAALTAHIVSVFIYW
ncbi:MAG TPA: hypothetical protein VFP36_08710 [Usitatibacter sp.]|nr:hypothetical protein [Usitatibacter sp.]